MAMKNLSLEYVCTFNLRHFGFVVVSFKENIEMLGENGQFLNMVIYIIEENLCSVGGWVAHSIITNTIPGVGCGRIRSSPT